MTRILPLFCGCAVLFIGCNSDVPMIKAKGKVSLDGVPLEKGLVRFEATDGKSPSSKGGEIANGEFTADVPSGDVIVRITSPKAAAKKEAKADEGPRNPAGAYVEAVPKKYNVESTLKETIKSGMADLEFKLLTK